MSLLLPRERNRNLPPSCRSGGFCRLGSHPELGEQTLLRRGDSPGSSRTSRRWMKAFSSSISLLPFASAVGAGARTGTAPGVSGCPGRCRGGFCIATRRSPLTLCARLQFLAYGRDVKAFDPLHHLPEVNPDTALRCTGPPGLSAPLPWDPPAQQAAFARQQPEASGPGRLRVRQPLPSIPVRGPLPSG